LRIQATANDVNLGPMRVIAPAVKLTAAVLADRHDERGVRDLGPEAEGVRPVKLLRPVDREAVRRATEEMGQERDGGRVRTKMGVQVRRAGGAELAEQQAC